MRIGFAGTPEFAATIFKYIHKHTSEVVRVFTQPPRPAGRGRKLKPSSVQRLAEASNIEVHVPSRLTEMAAAFTDLDVLVVAAYGLLLPRSVLSAPRHGCINVHASLLPRWRGASPIEHAILHGDTTTGVSIMQMDAGMDTGPVYSQATLPLSGTETLSSLTSRLADLGSAEIVNVLNQLSDGTPPEPQPQNNEAVVYAPRVTPSDALIHWHKSALQVERQVRAFNGRGGAFTTVGTTRLRILQAHVTNGDILPGTLSATQDGWDIGCGEGCLRLGEVQLNRGKGTPMRINDAANGYPDLFLNGLRFDRT